MLYDKINVTAHDGFLTNFRGLEALIKKFDSYGSVKRATGAGELVVFTLRAVMKWLHAEIAFLLFLQRRLDRLDVQIQ